MPPGGGGAAVSPNKKQRGLDRAKQSLKKKHSQPASNERKVERAASARRLDTRWLIAHGETCHRSSLHFLPFPNAATQLSSAKKTWATLSSVPVGRAKLIGVVPFWDALQALVCAHPHLSIPKPGVLGPYESCSSIRMDTHCSMCCRVRAPRVVQSSSRQNKEKDL